MLSVKKRLSVLILGLMLVLVPTFSLAPAYADDCGTKDDPKGQVFQGLGATGGDCNDKGVADTVSAAVQVLSYILGVASIIVITLSGFRYITSAGDTGKIATAKNTLIYALVGLVVAALAQFMVRYVVNTGVAASDGKCPTNINITVSDKNCK